MVLLALPVSIRYNIIKHIQDNGRGGHMQIRRFLPDADLDRLEAYLRE